MGFGVEVYWEVFGVLVFDDGFVFGEDHAVEVEGCLERGFFVEVAADGREHSRLAG